jgi:predicted O-linked N-acetylglucosamine transferase (SPINDLY family)
MDRSILTATSLPDLVCDPNEAYIARAVHLATHPDERSRIRRRLADNQTTAPVRYRTGQAATKASSGSSAGTSTVPAP